MMQYLVSCTRVSMVDGAVPLEDRCEMIVVMRLGPRAGYIRRGVVSDPDPSEPNKPGAVAL